jgi:hypothetical protein
MLMKSAKLMAAAGGVSMGGLPGVSAVGLKDDGTKYGKYIFYPPEELSKSERGTNVFGIGSSNIEGCKMNASVLRFDPPGPMPAHMSPEKHEDKIEVLSYLGNNPDDPMDLGADMDFFLGRGINLEKYPTASRSMSISVPAGQWHWPWLLKTIRVPITFVFINIPKGGSSSQGDSPGAGGMPGGDPGAGGPPGAGGQGGPVNAGGMQGTPTAAQIADGTWSTLTKEQIANARTSGYIYSHLLRSGVGLERKQPKGGQWIAYNDPDIIAETPLVRIIRYRPEEAPYSIINSQTHEYESIMIFHGIDHDDPRYLGAEIELSIGPEKEKHTIKESAIIYIPANTVHGPFTVKKSQKPFLFFECVGGPEHPGAVYNNE